ncbi:hypothetical protein QQZ08_009245 [Neonectria magnoliae]|uniref:Tryptophan synthase beta chain-like PALP domain-containing protein n=1 Tax=Neonectria magnoliae TaxID=2732573 RepID=A0ABR1HQS7_9HYPO
MVLPAPSSSALDAIGNTPVVRLHSVVPEGHADVFLKLEYLNPTGSYQDRMAKSIIEEAEHRGSSLAFVCAVKGYKLRVASSDAYSVAKLRTMTAFGAAVDSIKSPSTQITAELMPKMVEHVKDIAQRGDCYLADQGIDGFCGDVGAAGMVMGVAKAMKSRLPQIRVLVLEPTSAPTITEGRYGVHTVEGIGLGFVPPLLDRELYDEARSIHEGEARTMCRRLAKEEGLLVGISTGLNVVAAILLARELGPGRTVVTVACDTGLKYMNGDLYGDGCSLLQCE